MREVWMHILLVCVLFLTAAQIQPETVTIDGGVGTQISEILTITNTQARPVQYTFALADFSTYLSKDIQPTQETFALQPQESKNIQVTGVVPALGPEVHQLIYELKENQRVVASSIIRIPIEGNPDLQPALEIQTEDTSVDQALQVTAQMANFGNIIAYYQLELYINEAGKQIGTLAYPQAIQVLPGEEQELVLTYTDTLEPGDYTVELIAEVNEQEKLTATQPFIVTLNTQQERINQGEDLVIELKRYNSNPRVTYAVAKNGEIQLQETLIADQDTLHIPTATLEQGEYDVQIQVISADQTETQSFVLEIQSKQVIPSWIVYVLLIAGSITFFWMPSTRLHIKIALLSIRIHQREKRLNTLIHRAHMLEERDDA